MSDTNQEIEKNEPQPLDSLEAQRGAVINAIKDARIESLLKKRYRLQRNRKNWRAYNGFVDWSHKKKGQSRIHLHKTGLAAEQTVTQLEQGLMNFDQWIEMLPTNSYEDPIITPHVAKCLMSWYLDDAKARVAVSDAFKLALFESRATIQVCGEEVDVPRFVAKNKKTLERRSSTAWRLRLNAIPYEDYHVDGYDGTLYEMHEDLVDKHYLMRFAKSEENKDGIYREETLESLGQYERFFEEQRKSENRGDPLYFSRMSRRQCILRTEYWGTILDQQTGLPMIWKVYDEDGNETGEQFPLENIVCTMANERVLIQDPQPNPRWAGINPFVSCLLIRSPGSTSWAKAVMDAGVDLNMAADELFNLMLDGALSSVHGIKQLRQNYLAKPEQASGAIPSGTTLLANDSLPPNMKLMERVDTGSLPPEAISMFQIVSSLFAENVFSNQINLSGQLPTKQVRATEIQAANASIEGVFEGIAAKLEDMFIEKLAEQCWYDILQNADKIDDDDMLSIFQGDQARLDAFKKLTPQQRFARAARGFKFRGKGVRALAARMKDFQRLQTVLQSLAASPALFQEFQNEYSMPKLLGKIMRSVGIDEEELRLSAREQQLKDQMRLIRQQALSQAELQGQGAPQGQPGTNVASAPGSNEQPGTEPGNQAGAVNPNPNG